jgi:hypothetical protein
MVVSFTVRLSLKSTNTVLQMEIEEGRERKKKVIGYYFYLFKLLYLLHNYNI